MMMMIIYRAYVAMVLQIRWHNASSVTSLEAFTCVHQSVIAVCGIPQFAAVSRESASPECP